MIVISKANSYFLYCLWQTPVSFFASSAKYTTVLHSHSLSVRWVIAADFSGALTFGFDIE